METSTNKFGPPEVLRRAIAQPRARRMTASDAFSLARKRWLSGQRIDLGALAAELGIARATMFRWVGSRELLLGEILWSVCAPALTRAENATDPALTGAPRVAAICANAIRAIMDFAPLRRFLDDQPEYALRLLTSKAGPVQGRAITSVQALIQREVAAGTVKAALALDTLAYLVVRIAESFVYAEVISGQTVDVRDAGLAIELLLSGRVRKAPAR
jgi:hypothetical protein